MDDYKNYNIFFSWQSDIKKNKRVIREGIKSAIENLKDLGNFHLIEDSRGTPGAANLTVEIFNKIDSSSIFVGDVTVINQNTNNRKTPNPNVLIELGYAKKALGENNMILLYDKCICNPNDLPFDIRSNRVIGFCVEESATVSKAIESTIRELNKSQTLAVCHEEIARIPEFNISLETSTPRDGDDKKYFENSRFAEIDGKEINLKISKLINLEYEYNYKKIDLEDVPEGLNVKQEDIEEYNNNLPGEETIRNYIEAHNNFQRIHNNGVPFCIMVNNIGSSPANNVVLKIDANNTDIIDIYETDHGQFMKEPPKLSLPNNPIEQAMYEKTKKNSSFEQLENCFNSTMFFRDVATYPKIIYPSLSTNLPSDLLNKLKKHETSNSEMIIQKNIGSYDCVRIGHKETIVIRGILIVPLQTGKYELNVQIKCDEFADYESHKFTINVEREK